MKRLFMLAMAFGLICTLNTSAFGYANDAIQRAKAQRLQDYDKKVNDLYEQKASINSRSDLSDREKEVYTRSTDKQINLYSSKADSIEKSISEESGVNKNIPSASALIRRKQKQREIDYQIELLNELEKDIDSNTTLNQTQKSVKKHEIQKKILDYQKQKAKL